MSVVEQFVNIVEQKGVWVHSEPCNTTNDEIKSKSNFSDKGIAEMKQGIGNILFSEMQYEMASRIYTEAIELHADCPSYIARSSCFMMMHKYSEALDDAKRAVDMDPNSVEAFLQIARCALALGNCNEAHRALNNITELGTSSIEAKLETTKIRTIYTLQDESDKAFSRGEYGKVIRFSDRILVRLPSRTVKLRRAECLALLGHYEQANDIASSVLILDKNNVDALYVLSVCHFYQGHVDIAAKRLDRLFELEPDYTKAKPLYEKVNNLKNTRDSAKKSLEEGRISESYKLYSDALKIDPQNAVINSQLYFSRAMASFKSRNLKEAIQDCTSALKLNKRDIQSMLLRGKSYMALREYKMAIEDFEFALKMRDNWENRRLLQEAKLALVNDRKMDFYKILGINRLSSMDEIKRAYWKKALLHHPDKHSKASQEVKKEHEKMFKEVAQAYETLSDPRKRFMYDHEYYKPPCF